MFFRNAEQARIRAELLTAFPLQLQSYLKLQNGTCSCMRVQKVKVLLAVFSLMIYATAKKAKTSH